jgi:outer membrane protein
MRRIAEAGASAMETQKKLRASATGASACLIFALFLSVTHAADLTTSAPPEAVAPTAAAPPLWFVKVGAFGAINQSSSKLYGQPLSGVVIPGIGFVPTGGVGPQTQLVGRGASYSNLFSLGIEVGYFFASNWSVDISGGVPVWETVKITGHSATPPASGAVLAKVLPGAAPITVLYHFTQFGALQPYVGGGIVPSFAFAVQDGFNTGSSIEPSLGVVLQGGVDYMFNRNWGVFFDAKKIFTQLEGHSTGINLGAPLGTIPAAATIKTDYQPWLLAGGVVYRF